MFRTVLKQVQSSGKGPRILQAANLFAVCSADLCSPFANAAYVEVDAPRRPASAFCTLSRPPMPNQIVNQ